MVTGDYETTGYGGSLVYAQKYPKAIDKTALALQLEHLGSPDLSNGLNTIKAMNVKSFSDASSQ